MRLFFFTGIICLVFILAITSSAIQTDSKTLINSSLKIVSTNNTVVPQTGGATQLLMKNIWNLKSVMKNGKTKNPVLGTTINAVFLKDGNLNGNAGCNNYIGTYKITGNKITIGQVGSTLMFCSEPKGVMEQETLYTSMLTKVSTFSVTESSLSLADSTGKNKLNFEKYTPPTLSGSWVLDSIGANNTVSSVIKGSNITALFSSDGNLTGSAGCNHYNANFQTKDDNLTISPVISTRMYCSEPKGVMEQETTYLSNLEKVKRYTIAKNTLELMNKDGKALLFYLPP